MSYKIGFRLAVVAWAVSVIAVLTWAASMKRPIEEITYTTEVVEVVETTAVYEPWTVDQEDAEMLARLAWCEGRGCTTTNQAAVMWCVLNRVDDPRFPDSIKDVILVPGQFYYLGLPWTAWETVASFYMKKSEKQCLTGGITFESAKAKNFVKPYSYEAAQKSDDTPTI